MNKIEIEEIKDIIEQLRYSAGVLNGAYILYKNDFLFKERERILKQCEKLETITK